MQIRPIEELKQELDNIMHISHPGNIQLKVNEKCTLHQVESSFTDYEPNGKLKIIQMKFYFTFYGVFIHTEVKKEEESYSVVFAEAEDLLSSFEEFIEDEGFEIIPIVWEAVEKWINR